MSKYLLRIKKLLLYMVLIGIILIIGVAIYYFSTLYTVKNTQEGYLALTGSTAILGEELKPKKDATVLIRDGIIIEIGDRAEVDIPLEATVLDLEGYTLMPGLVDLHIHLGSPEIKPDQKFGPLSMPKLILDLIRYDPDRRKSLLNYGVTTVRSLGDEYDWIMELRRMVQSGELEGPRLYTAGPVFTTLGGHPVATIGGDPESDSVRIPSSSDEARLMVRELALGDRPVDLIKIIQERGNPERPLEPIKPDILKAIVEEAKSNGLPVFAHWGNLEDLKDVLEAGVQGLEHLEAKELLDGWPQEIFDELIEKEIYISPTFAVTEGVFPSEIHQQLQNRLEELHNAGGKVLVGSDAPMQGVAFGAGVHQELELLVESGIAPREALIAATSRSAKALSAEDIGAIIPGRAADLLVLDGNPIENIENIRNVVMVFRDGRLVVDNRNQ